MLGGICALDTKNAERKGELGGRKRDRFTRPITNLGEIDRWIHHLIYTPCFGASFALWNAPCVAAILNFEFLNCPALTFESTSHVL